MKDSTSVTLPHGITRRSFLQSLSAAGAAFGISHAAPALVSDPLHRTAASRSKKITFLEDGGFTGSAWGWQFTSGAKVDRYAGRGSLGAVHIKTDSGDYARFLVLGPVGGRTYTLSGWVRTEGIVAAQDACGAYVAASQFEFQGRPTEFTVDGKQATEIRYENLTGTNGWRRFSQSVKCQPTSSWFEVVVGIYRASGEAWFSGLTFVEGDQDIDIADSVLPREAAEWSHRDVIARAGRSRPKAALLNDRRLPVRGTKTEPKELARLLNPFYDVAYLDAAKLADTSVLNIQNFDLLVLPYGETFPLAAKDAMLKFLAAGGNLLTTGGYAFQSPVVEEDGQWKFVDEVDEQHSLGKQLLPGFRDADAAWKSTGSHISFLPNKEADAGAAARIETPKRLREHEETLTYELPASGEGRQFSFRARWRTFDVTPAPDGSATIGVEQLDEHGELAYAARVDFAELRGTNDWQSVERLFFLVPDCVKLRVHVGLKSATGAVEVEDFQLVERQPLVRINTAHGWPVDYLQISNWQLGIFDADYRLRRVEAVQTLTLNKQAAVKSELQAEGYAASGITGMNAARWVPLLQAVDSDGRNRGAAGALLHHHGGEYVRSSWAYFGVSNHNLFAEGCQAGLAALHRALKSLVAKCYLHSLESNYATYRDGEPVHLRALLSNYGLHNADLQLEVRIQDASKVVYKKRRTVSVRAGQTAVLEDMWQPVQFDAANYSITVDLQEGTQVIDSIESGFCAWKQQSLAAGMPIEFRDNYFHVEGKTVFLQGTDDYLHTFIDQEENAGTWLVDARGCRDSSIDVYENLMGLRGPQQRPTETWWRWVDAMVLNTQSIGGIFFPGMLVFSNTAVTDADLGDQLAYAKKFAGRYRDAQGIMYYLNGDLELHDPNLPDLQRLYNEYLQERYGNDAALKQAWSLSPPEQTLGKLTIHSGTTDWQDVRTADDFRFRTFLVRRWLNAMYDSIREVDSKHPVTAEFYQEPVSGIDLLNALGKLELANFGYFAEKEKDYYRFPQVCRFLDQSMRGKGINVGEFGVKTHPAWNDTGYYIEARSEEYEQSYFLSLTHYAFALGASKVQNWCWKYPADLAFEWGLNYPNDLVPRDVRAFYRNSGLLFRSLRPRYEASETVVLLASESRMGGQGKRIVEGQLNCIRLLQDANVRFGTLTDEYLSELPKRVKTLIYPLAFCPSDMIVEQLTAFVENGGQLYLSGDISYSALRQRTEFSRLEKLCGVHVVAENYPHITYGDHAVTTQPVGSHWPQYEASPTLTVRTAGAEVLLADAAGHPVVTSYQLGKGKVVLSLDPIELHGDPRYQTYAHQFYSAILNTFSIPCEQIVSTGGQVHCFHVPSHDERSLQVLVNYGEKKDTVKISSVAGMVELVLGSRMPGVVVGNEFGLHAVESSGLVTLAGKNLIEANVHSIYLTLDGKAITSSHMLLILPMSTGTITMHFEKSLAHPVLLRGEIVAGRWKQYASESLAMNGSLMSLHIGDQHSLSMLVLCEEQGVNDAIQRVETLSQTPWKMEDIH